MVRRLQGWVLWRQRAVSQGPPAPESTVQPHSTPRSCLPSAAGPPAVRVQGQHGAPHADGAIPHFRAVWWLAVPWNAALLRDSSICKKVFFQQSYAVWGSDLPSSLTLSYPRYLVISPHTKYICELKKNKQQNRMPEMKGIPTTCMALERVKWKNKHPATFHFIANAVTNLVTLTDWYLRPWAKIATSRMQRRGSQWFNVLVLLFIF